MFGDGLQTRDYVYVGDVVAPNLAAAESDAGGPFNIGTGVQTSVLDLVEALAPHADDGSSPSSARAPRRGAPHRARRLARASELGWEAEVGISEGLERTLDSLR